jgi:hypothetical protein
MWMKPLALTAAAAVFCLCICSRMFALHPVFCILATPAVEVDVPAPEPAPLAIVSSFAAHSEFTRAQLAVWEQLNPEYTAVGFDDAEAREWLRANCEPWVTPLYDAVNHGPIRGDIFRVLYLAKKGGVWADIDVGPQLPLRDWGSTSQLWVPKGRHPRSLNPTVIIARPADPSLLAAVKLYKQLAQTVFVGRSYWALSVVHVLSTLRNHRHPMDTAATEVCPSFNLHECYIKDAAGAILFYNRVVGWNPLTHAESLLLS